MTPSLQTEAESFHTFLGKEIANGGRHKSPEDLVKDWRRGHQELRPLADVDAGHAIMVPILSFAPACYAPVGDLKAVLEETSEGFTATLYDANIGASGETENEAIEGLKENIVQVFEMLERQPKLGPGPARQLAVLKSLIKKA